MRITTESCNIVADPFDSNAMVEQTQVSCFAWRTGIAKDTDRLVDCNDDNIFLVGKMLTVVE